MEFSFDGHKLVDVLFYGIGDVFMALGIVKVFRLVVSEYLKKKE